MFNLYTTFIYFRLELYFSNKQDSPGNTSKKVDLSLSGDNNTFVQLQSNKQIDLNTSKEIKVNETIQNNVAGKQIYMKIDNPNSCFI